ncbi:Tat pathway signal sequence domain protein [Streptomyces ipomoeae]|uniref:Tat pathway signal sequence domain protein n=2 Tax=Streptomyces ipomoeae TaxID=103232 RepID=A0AAE9AZ03_9ACTN|nr:Tat pathway signal sequence domain protein [Streptomyces ipomoeae]TQE27618.1 Tat pathway signal sequence domain protein [Streptomyces ipomoeae]
MVPRGRSGRQALAMSGVGPVEPGEGTRARELPEPDTEAPPPPPAGRFARAYTTHRRAVLAATTTAAVLAGGGYLYATRPEPPPPPLAPYPSQAVGVLYLGPVTPATSPTNRTFTFEMEVKALSDPPITVERMRQPYAALSLTTDPRTPFRTEQNDARTIVITMRVTECEKVPENAGLPFLDVTLRNTRAIEEHSFILGERYAQDLSNALHVACGNKSPSSPKA